jgi:hypothetical protein
MKKILPAILLLSAIIMLSACSAGIQPDSTGQQSGSSEFSNIDFSGSWLVSEIFSPNGEPAKSADYQLIEAGFKLELLDGGIYFVYGQNGAVLGQGVYSVSGSQLTCTAGSVQTIYQILDPDTLQSVADDKSITVMARQPEPSPTVPEEDVPDDHISGGDDDQKEPADSIVPDETPDVTDGSSANPSG